jgi:hypothetical protein
MMDNEYDPDYRQDEEGDGHVNGLIAADHFEREVLEYDEMQTLKDAMVTHFRESESPPY